MSEISSELRERIARVTAKRPRIVLEHILQHGFITTDELKRLYGYNHPPRAARDVRERGIPLITDSVVGPDGRTIAAYHLPAEAEFVAGRIGGRRAVSKGFKRLLLERDGERCALCDGRFSGNVLQVDHTAYLRWSQHSRFSSRRGQGKRATAGPPTLQRAASCGAPAEP